MRRHSEVQKSAFNEMVGLNVRRFRHALGASQARLSDDVGVSQSMLQNIETGTIACPLFVARNIAEVVDCTLDDLVPVTIDESAED
jgi:DNA-binding XRE family transcriptional regulator